MKQKFVTGLFVLSCLTTFIGAASAEAGPLKPGELGFTRAMVAGKTMSSSGYPNGTITFGSDLVVQLTTAELLIDKPLTIDGVGHTVSINGPSTSCTTCFRVFNVNAGAVFVLQNLTVASDFEIKAGFAIRIPSHSGHDRLLDVAEAIHRAAVHFQDTVSRAESSLMCRPWDLFTVDTEG